ncbi:MAG: primosomal protein N' [Lachnospiraceae bacterium]|nr:primosomal protein N' [Lachnospiraceae bacterium]
MGFLYANIIVDIAHEKVDRPFQYKIPDALQTILRVGMAVIIPFGKGNRKRVGYVVELTNKAEYDPDKLKEIDEIKTGGVAVEEHLIRLAAWMKEQYGSTMITALKTVLPVKQTYKAKEKRTVRLLLPKEEAQARRWEFARKHNVARERLLAELIQEGELPYELITGKLNVTAKTIQALQEQGILAIDTKSYYRNPVTLQASVDEKKTLSEEQEAIVTDVLSSYREGRPGVSLLHGITGSGKTEVYMELIAGMVAQGKQAIVLIPEIALTYQTLLRFYKRFGDRVSVMNSKLSQGEKYDQCERAKKGEIDIIIGPRSALFTPFPNLGLIIIDEEHESSYKSESMPKYHAREVAIELASYHGACVVLGSATPSIEAYYHANNGHYKLFRLTKRLTGGVLPDVYTIDLREELREGNRSIFSRKLQELIQDRLEKKEQIMLFLNRRGYAGFVSCRACGHVLKCPHCDVSLSEHRNGKMICHYCGYEERKASLCPSCGSKFILGFKAGTQQIEDVLHTQFPQAKVLRMDADTTKSKDSYEEILSAFSNKEADILVGTQMIVKGHDFPDVTLVGILAADLSLSANDYRAGERTFQLLTQAAGRAGRGSKAGEVVIQTYQPEHYSIIQAAKQDYEAFYEEEMMYRDLLLYPPAAHMMSLLVISRTEETGAKLADRLAACMKSYMIEKKAVIIGPAPASIGKINDMYRHVIYVKHKEYAVLTQMKDRLEEWIEQMELKNEAVQFDFNPMNTY